MAFQDHFSRQSAKYTEFRPHYPAALFEYLASLPAGRNQAWDCGTGNGQAAVDLAPYFSAVIATDPSQRQIASAVAHPNVRYLIATAEDCPLADRSVDLVTVAQAVHWFDRPAFYRQVERVARPGGILAVWCYALAKITPQIDRIVWYLYEDVLGTYWPPDRALVMEGYSTIEFPFEEITPPLFEMTAEWSLHDLIGYLGTWSSTQHYIARHGDDPVAAIAAELKSAWGSADDRRRVEWPLYLRVGRINTAD